MFWLLKQLHITMVSPSQLHEYKNIKDKSARENNQVYEWHKCYFQIQMFSGYSPKIYSLLNTFSQNSRMFPSKHSHNLQFHVCCPACKLCLTVAEVSCNLSKLSVC
eukprot:GFUD01130908.1.p1 GENE.GFUD01130908.1~~GFUD01130908.1.p1  ORF type:complete len:106 (+),score=0.37 GFUD01130908.1:162-479(+)